MPGRPREVFDGAVEWSSPVIPDEPLFPYESARIWISIWRGEAYEFFCVDPVMIKREKGFVPWHDEVVSSPRRPHPLP